MGQGINDQPMETYCLQECCKGPPSISRQKALRHTACSPRLSLFRSADSNYFRLSQSLVKLRKSIKYTSEKTEQKC